MGTVQGGMDPAGGGRPLSRTTVYVGGLLDGEAVRIVG